MLITTMASVQARVIIAKRAFKNRIEGATAIEYGLIAGGISLAIVAAVFAFGKDLNTLFETIGGKMADASKQASDSSGGGGGGTTP